MVEPQFSYRQNPDRHHCACAYCGICAAIDIAVEALAMAEEMDVEFLPSLKDSASLTDPTLAAERLNLPALVFFQAGNWSMSKLADLYAKANGIPISRARAEIEVCLSDMLQTVT